MELPMPYPHLETAELAINTRVWAVKVGYLQQHTP